MTKDGVCRNLRYDVMLAVQSSMLSPPGEGEGKKGSGRSVSRRTGREDRHIC